MTFYSKDNAVNSIAAMKKSGRMMHAFLLHGEKGVGKKLIAKHIAKTIMCDFPVDGNPCGQCRQCRRIDQDIHPDVITPERTGKTLIYSAETIGRMYDESFTKPNDCDAKVYLLPDCENMIERTQNKMLKLIEEPPSHAYFVFTASDKSVFLPTIISRVITFGISECTDEECRLALAERGKYPAERIDEAVEVCHGNIGNALEYLEDEHGSQNVALCREIVRALIGGDEYMLYKSLYDVGEDRNRVKNVLLLLDKVIRDVCIIRLHGKDNARLMGCFREGAEKLAERLSFRKAEDMHILLTKTIDYCHSNVNAAAAMASLCGGLM